MLELAYLTNVLQLLRQRSHSLEDMLLETRRNYSNENSTSQFQRRSYEQNEPLRFVQQFPPQRPQQLRPPNLGLFTRQSQQTDVTERNSRSTDPLDFNQFMNEMYRMFPFD